MLPTRGPPPVTPRRLALVLSFMCRLNLAPPLSQPGKTTPVDRRRRDPNPRLKPQRTPQRWTTPCVGSRVRRLQPMVREQNRRRLVLTCWRRSRTSTTNRLVGASDGRGTASLAECAATRMATYIRWRGYKPPAQPQKNKEDLPCRPLITDHQTNPFFLYAHSHFILISRPLVGESYTISFTSLVVAV